MEIVEKFQSLVDQYFAEEHNVSFYEEKLGLKPKHLSKILKKENKNSPCQILLEKQLEYSQELLKTSNITVKEVGFKLGFDDPYHFSKLFKTKVGVSPSDYRKENT